jgi:hypothetical protein
MPPASVHRQIGEDLAVDLDARRVQPGDEPAVADLVLVQTARRR